MVIGRKGHDCTITLMHWCVDLEINARISHSLLVCGLVTCACTAQVLAFKMNVISMLLTAHLDQDTRTV